MTKQVKFIDGPLAGQTSPARTDGVHVLRIATADGTPFAGLESHAIVYNVEADETGALIGRLAR